MAPCQYGSADLNAAGFDTGRRHPSKTGTARQGRKEGRRMKRMMCLGAALGAVLLLSSAAGFEARAESLTKVKALIPIPNFDESFAPIAVAKYLGYFAEAGLDVTLLTAKGSNEAAIQVSAGNADLAAASVVDAVIGLQPGKGLDVKYFYELYYHNIWSMSVPAESPIQSIAELKGKKLGVVAMGSTGISFGRAYLTEAGLDPDHDVNFLPIGVGAQAIIAVRQKVVEGLVFNDAALAKFKVLGMPTRVLPVSEMVANLPDTGLLTRRETIKNNPQMLIAFARAVDKGYHFNMANPAAAVKITWKLYPEAEPKNMPPDEALRQGIAVNQARMAIWSSPKTGNLEGKFIDADWNNLVSFMMQQKLLQQPVPTDIIYTNELIEKINDFDRKPVRDQAAAFDLQKLK
jgi:NitT/TauT family transport system substrate-binding protein